jgi:hypothetical protein
VVADLLRLPLKLAIFDRDSGAFDRDDTLGTSTLSLEPLLTSFLLLATVIVTHKGLPRGIVHLHASWTTPKIDRDLLHLSRAETSLAISPRGAELGPALLEQVTARE